ncbi:VOC family protein [Myxococcota bacterium]|nr:VOC family protein [Myxococcota bacterium]
MKIKKISPLVTVREIASVKEFYKSHFSAKITFEMPERHLSLTFDEAGAVELGYMVADQCTPFTGEGVILCLEVADPDAEHDRLVREGVTVTMPLQDNPWGDRAFGVKDPAGVTLYIFKLIEADESFRQYVKV